MNETKSKTPRRGKPISKVAQPAAITPPPTLALQVVDSVESFLAYGALLEDIEANLDTASGSSVVQYIRAIIEWLTTYAGATREQIAPLPVGRLISVFKQAGAAFAGADIPQPMSAP